jgi:PST family polysaccharide transporter
VANEGGLLRHLAVRGAGVTVISGAIGQAIQIIATVILARLLTPADFGLVAMVTTFSLLFMNFGLNGFTEAVLQREEINQFLVSNLFWINLAMGLFLTAGFASAGLLMAKFYNNSHLTTVVAGISSSIFITSTSVFHLALLKRAMSFSVLSVNDIVARIVSVGASILLALNHWGYWALVSGVIAQSLSISLGAFILCRWVPRLPRRVVGTGAMVRFAMHVYGRFSFNYCARNLDNVLVGWRFNAQALGFYKKAYDLFALSAPLFVQSLTSVSVSALSRLKQESQQFRRYLLNSLSLAAFVGMGLGTDLTLVGKDVIRLLLGPAWEPAGQIFMFFGPGIGVMFIYGIHSWIHLSIGRADRWLRWTIFEFTVTGLLFILGLRWGPSGIALAWTASFWILTIPAFWYAGRPINFRIGPVFTAVWKYILAGLIAGCGTALAIKGLPSLVAASNSFWTLARIVSVSSLFGILYIGMVVLLHRSFAPLYQVVRLLREMLPGSGLTSTQSLTVASVQDR